MTADNLYKQQNYEEAAKEYLTLTLKGTLSLEQKVHAYFRLGVCQYNLGNYERATDSFGKVADFNPSDSVAYNNAAVCAYYTKNIKKAIEMQQKALEILPAVEYYYNLARMYEDNEEYQLAVNNFLVVAKGEHNISKIERIDPVRVKEKVARLQPQQLVDISDTVNKILIALKIKDSREILTLNDNEMQLKQADFNVNVENIKGAKKIVGQYDRSKNDPYSLISEIIWTVYKDGKQVYKNQNDKITVNVKEGGNYLVKLGIKYNGKELISEKTVTIVEDKSTIDEGSKDEIVLKPSIDIDKKTYVYSIYEQLFENDFEITASGYTDSYNVVWGRDNFIEVKQNKKIVVDKTSSLLVNNRNKKDAGLWINLDSLLVNDDIKGKPVSINFFARKVSENANLFVSVRVKSNNMIATTPETFYIPFQFEQQRLVVYIPEDASGFTISIKTSPGEEFNIDGFTIID
jgi:tetratricopeptide (TPR) repeat protein